MENAEFAFNQSISILLLFGLLFPQLILELQLTAIILLAIDELRVRMAPNFKLIFSMLKCHDSFLGQVN
jgi:hypothetical protein